MNGVDSSSTPIKGDKPNWRDRVLTYLGTVFAEQGGIDHDLLAKYRALIKWCFDVVRNAIIVGGLKYLSAKNPEKAALWYLSEASMVGLVVYCLTYVQSWRLELFHPWHHRKWVHALDVLISIVLLMAFVWVVIAAIPLAVQEIADTQSGR